MATNLANLLFLNSVLGGDNGSGFEESDLTPSPDILVLCRAGTAHDPAALLGGSAGGVSLVLFTRNELKSASSSSLSSESEPVTANSPSLTTRLLEVVELIGIEDVCELSGAVESVDVDAKDATPDESFVDRTNCGGGIGGAAICSGDIDFDFEDMLPMLPSSTRRCGVADAFRKGESTVGVTSATPVVGLMLRDCGEFCKLPVEAEAAADCDFDNRGLVRFRLRILMSVGELSCGDACERSTVFGLYGVVTVAF